MPNSEEHRADLSETNSEAEASSTQDDYPPLEIDVDYDVFENRQQNSVVIAPVYEGEYLPEDYDSEAADAYAAGDSEQIEENIYLESDDYLDSDDNDFSSQEPSSDTETIDNNIDTNIDDKVSSAAIVTETAKKSEQSGNTIKKSKISRFYQASKKWWQPLGLALWFISFLLLAILIVWSYVWILITSIAVACLGLIFSVADFFLAGKDKEIPALTHNMPVLPPSPATVAK